MVRTYAYSARDEMLTIEEPGWVINNTFDENGRVVRQVTQLADSDEPIILQFAYTVRDESVVQTDMTRNGVRTRYTYNGRGYELSETLDADGVNPISITYDRSEATNLVSALTVRCIGPDGHVIRNVAARSGTEDATARAVIRQECRR